MIQVSNYEASKAWYTAALSPLGVKVIKEVPEAKACGFGTCFPSFWITQQQQGAALNAGGDGGSGGSSGSSAGGRRQVHFAFQAASRAKVREFHAAALAAGGRDNGGPGFRPQYHPMYYGAFVLDPDGYNVEAVKHMPEGPAEWLGMLMSMLRAALRRLLAAVPGLAALATQAAAAPAKQPGDAGAPAGAACQGCGKAD
ncbi:hypothetical protein HYH02_005057 [Chlamydomonas schloesseri]|uniref:VOC domain-containing protein n=1 Tax=Chlamydomonas schloesseri TaxID=2026947 RepID=A0A835WPC6_9CHLO|nr:hypothetical protein HYH02_005057 [Chlamydomonas schloesseri]|eukprot:KAG2450556.1 hypothetical protein HYH02_005057 [Chlamydomonas schloesseri]